MDEPIDMQQTGNKIKEYMELSNITIRDIANMTNISYQAVWKYTRGQSLPTIQHLLTISKLFGCTVEDLIVTQPWASTNKQD